MTSLDGYDAAEGAQLGYEAALARTEAGDPALGYIYSHRQDLQRVVLTGELYVGFGDTSDDPEKTTAIGRLAVTAFERAGLPVQWDGDPEERILIAPFRWEGPYLLEDEPADADSGDDTELPESVLRVLYAKKGGQLDADRLEASAGAEVLEAHAAMAGAYPPDDDETFAGSLMLGVAIGVDATEDIRVFIDSMIEGGHFDEAYPNETAPTMQEAEALLERVITEHDRLVPDGSADLALFIAATTGVLASQGVVLTLDRFDDEYAADEGMERAWQHEEQTGITARGFVYCTHKDLRRAVLHGELRVGFGAMVDDSEEVVAVGRLAEQVFETIGLPVGERLPAPYAVTDPDEAAEAWVGNPGERIVIRPFRWQMPFRDDEDDQSSDSAEEGSDRRVCLIDRYGSLEDDASYQAFAVLLYSLLEDDSDREHCVVNIADSDGWYLEYTARSVAYYRVEPDEEVGSYVFADIAEALTVAADFIGGDLDAVRARPWVS